MDLNNPIVQWAIKLIVGAIGSNGVAAAIKKFNLGPIVNTIIGLVGGAAGGTILDQVMGTGAAMPEVAQEAAGAGAGGAGLMVIAGILSQMMNKKK